MQNNDTTVWLNLYEVNKDQEAELRKIGFIEGVYTCPCGTCDSQSVIFLEFPSKKEADAFYAILEDSELLSSLFA